MHKGNPMDEVRDRLQGGNDLGGPLKAINSNAAITVPSLWLKVGDNGLSAKTLERLVRNDEVARFRTRGLLEEFQRNDPKKFPNDYVLSQGC
jgi:hypothetical protein